MSVRRLVLPLLVCLAASLATAAPAAAHRGHPSPPAHARCLPVDATGASARTWAAGRPPPRSSVGGVAGRHDRGRVHDHGRGRHGRVVHRADRVHRAGRHAHRAGHRHPRRDHGVFTSTSTSVTGTGLLRRVTGDLTFTGTEDLATGAFTESITDTSASPAATDLPCAPVAASPGPLVEPVETPSVGRACRDPVRWSSLSRPAVGRACRDPPLVELVETSGSLASSVRRSCWWRWVTNDGVWWRWVVGCGTAPQVAFRVAAGLGCSLVVAVSGSCGR